MLDEVEDVPMVTTIEEYSFQSSPKGSHALNAFDWLLINLPTLPYFDAVRATCCTALRQVSGAFCMGKFSTSFVSEN